MKTEFFNFNIPDELIAQNPSEKRSESRLLVYDRKVDRIIDSHFKNIVDFLDKDSIIVFNNSKVMPARMFITNKMNKRKGELLILKIIAQNKAEVLFDKAKKYKNSDEIVMPDGSLAKVIEELPDKTKIILSEKPIFNIEYMEKYGNIPLPPYIRNKNTTENDKIRYQTIYSKYYGSAAAPTAGLHFDTEILKKIEDKGIKTAFVCLHVGLGTFQPIYKENIEEHKIHKEEYFIDQENADEINKAIKNGKKIIAVGTTSLRTLETAFKNGAIDAGKGESSLYIYPPYKLKIVNSLITNFHTPKSTLLVLVAAIVGYEKLKEIYCHAIKEKYRFFSYGDAMLIV